MSVIPKIWNKHFPKLEIPPIKKLVSKVCGNLSPSLKYVPEFETDVANYAFTDCYDRAGAPYDYAYHIWNF